MPTTAEIEMSALSDAPSIADGDLILILQSSTGPGTGTVRLMSGSQLLTYVTNNLLANGLAGIPTSEAGLSAGQLWNNGGVLCIA